MSRAWRCGAVIAFVLVPAVPVAAQSGEEAAVLAVADAAFVAISAEDWVGFTDLMVPGAHLYTPIRRDGGWTLRVRTREEQRNDSLDEDVVERGFEPTVLVSGSVAVVWYPYDLYLDGQWSHCGIDVFNLGRTDAGWRILSMSWSFEQPPDCRPHPDGPPPGATGPGSS